MRQHSTVLKPNSIVKQKVDSRTPTLSRPPGSLAPCSAASGTPRLPEAAALSNTSTPRRLVLIWLFPSIGGPFPLVWVLGRVPYIHILYIHIWSALKRVRRTYTAPKNVPQGGSPMPKANTFCRELLLGQLLRPSWFLCLAQLLDISLYRTPFLGV